MKLISIILIGICSVVANGYDVYDINDMSTNWLSAGPASDLDANGIVNLRDYAILANDFSGELIYNPPAPPPPPPPEPPHANDVNVAATAHQKQLVIMDANEGSKFIITSLPQSAMLQDPSPVAARVISEAPYYLDGNSVYVLSDSNGIRSFKYKARKANLVSDEATVTVDVHVAPMDFIYPKASKVVIDHNENLNFKSGFGLTFFIKTRWPDSKIISKYNGGAGWEVWMTNGCATLKLKDTLGRVSSTTNPQWIADGRWYQIGIGYKTGIPQNLHILVDNGDDIQTMDYLASIPDANYSNSEAIIVGETFIGAIDRVRIFTNIDPNNVYNWNITTSASLFPRNSHEEVISVIGWGDLSKFRWMCDKDGDSNLVEDKLNYNGKIQDDAGMLWYEPNNVQLIRDKVQLYTVKGDQNPLYTYDGNSISVPRGRERGLNGVFFK